MPPLGGDSSGLAAPCWSEAEIPLSGILNFLLSHPKVDFLRFHQNRGYINENIKQNDV
jgi:hypothetical protein